MLSIFQTIRLAIYATVLAWSLIVLGLGAFFDHLIIMNDLTRYIPLAIFVAVCTMIIIPTLLLAGSFKRTQLFTQVRSELAFVGLLGLLWFILGISTASGEASTIECDFDGDGDFVESDEYSTAMFHAQLRVLRAFSIFNAVLLLGFFLFLLVLAIRQHRMGRTFVWTSGVASYPWFGGAPVVPSKEFNVSSDSLPPPVTAKGANGAPQKGSTTTAPMQSGGHYIIYIPPPAGGQ